MSSQCPYCDGVIVRRPSPFGPYNECDTCELVISSIMLALADRLSIAREALRDIAALDIDRTMPTAKNKQDDQWCDGPCPEIARAALAKMGVKP